MLHPLTLAIACQLAYADSTFEAGGVEVLVREVGKHDVVFAFRGTEFDYGDILTDLGVPPSAPDSFLLWLLTNWRHPGPTIVDPAIGRVHAGFLAGVHEIYPQLEDEVRRQLAAGKRVHLTGHSKGGGEATEAAAILRRNNYAIATLTTFGSPRCVSWATAADWLGRVVVKRFVCGDDAVPSHPWPIWGLRHVGELIAVPGEGGRYEDHRLQSYIDGLIDN